MAKFIFRMQNILSIKYKLEDQAKAAYAVELGVLRQEEEKLRQLGQRLTEFQGRLRQEMVDFLDVFRIRELENGIENIKYNIQLQKIVIANQQLRVNRARQELDEAMKERKTYEKLRENEFEVFKQEINAQEQKEVDELVSFRFGDQGESEE